MGLLRPLPLPTKFLKPPKENVIVFFHMFPHGQEQSEGEHLYERQTSNCLEVSDEEVFRAEVLLDRSKKVLDLPSLLVPEEYLPCVIIGTHIDICENNHGDIEAVGVEQDEE